MPPLPGETLHAANWSVAAEAHSPESNHSGSVNAVALRPMVSHFSLQDGPYIFGNGVPGRLGYERNSGAWATGSV